MNEPIEIFSWNENFDSGIAQIDEQHKKLVHLLNGLASGIVYKVDKLELNAIFSELSDYAAYHFQSEESVWSQFLEDDPWESQHKKSHHDFVSQVNRLKDEDNSKPLEAVFKDVASFLTLWLTSHILESDKRMAKVVLALQSGLSLEQAKQHANQEMDVAMRFDFVNRMSGGSKG